MGYRLMSIEFDHVYGSFNSNHAHPADWDLSFFKKMLQMPHGGASTIIQIPTVGPQKEGKYLTHGTRSKFYLMMVAKNILIP